MAAPRALAFQITVGLGAFLLFLVQPLVAKQILPWFGGGPAVWSACLLFFQLALIVGYFYAHVTRRLGPSRQAWLHLGLLVVALAALPITPSPAWKPPDGSEPVLRVLGLLGASVGVPFVLLAATAPLLQDWFAAVMPARTPYRLYVLSNAGSLAALLAYPSLVEPNFTMRAQSLGWSVGFLLFAVACGWAASAVLRRAAPEAGAEAGDAPAAAVRLRPQDVLLWIVLPGITSGLLVAATNQLTQDIAAVPLIWMVPFTLYLATYIVTFAGWRARGFWAALLLLSVAFTLYAIRPQTIVSLWLQGAGLLIAFTSACMVCHAELVRLQPPASRLTAFYLALAVGGGLGGTFVAVVAPVTFDAYFELPLLLLAACAVAAFSALRHYHGRHREDLVTLASATVTAAFAVAMLLIWLKSGITFEFARARSFYGVLRVVEEPPTGDRPMRRLYHGHILHGMQFTQPSIAMTPTSYYTVNSGIAIAITHHPRRLAGEPLAIGAVGLGAGTIAALGQRGDSVRFYEIDSLVVEFARTYFTFLDRAPADVEIRLGDARLSLEREVAAPEGRHRYDVLAIDAFSGDSIPIHLLTRESFALYRDALKPDGILAVHITNRYLDLRPVVYGLADEAGWDVVRAISPPDYATRATNSDWLLVTTNAAFLAETRGAARRDPDTRAAIVWTDSFSSLLSVLR